MEFIQQWLIGRYPIRRAETQAEKEAIYRLRYRVYVEELRKHVADADHERKWIKDPEDDEPETVLFYAGTPDNVLGTIRQRIWQPGKVPPDVAELYAMHLFPGIENQMVSETSRFMVVASRRGGALTAALALGALQAIVCAGVSLNFAYCTAGLVKAYRRIGMRPYGAPLVPTQDGSRFPVVMLTSDLDYLKQYRSPLAPFIASHFGPGKVPPFNPAPYEALFQDSRSPVISRHAQVFRYVADTLHEGSGWASLLLQGLTPKEVRWMMKFAFVLRIPAGSVITSKGLKEEEIFVVLEGTLESDDGVRPPRELERGEVLGEVAFFSNSSLREATVSAKTDASVLLLKRSFLRQIMKHNPKLATKVLFNLGACAAHQVDDYAHGEWLTLRVPALANLSELRLR